MSGVTSNKTERKFTKFRYKTKPQFVGAGCPCEYLGETFRFSVCLRFEKLTSEFYKFKNWQKKLYKRQFHCAQKQSKELAVCEMHAMDVGMYLNWNAFAAFAFTALELLK